ncbi:MAG: ankyrin repeat domain-containing protein [Pseudomonadales bacterium]
MRRVMVILVLLLALGLATSIGVAWTSATMWRGYDLRNPLTSAWFYEPRVEVGQLNQWRLAQWTDATLTRRWGWGWRDEWFTDPRNAYLRRVTLGSDAEERTWGEIDVPGFSRAQRPPPEEPAPIALLVNALPSFEEREAGWPVRCLRVRWVAGDDRLDTPGERIRGGVLASYWVYPWGSTSFDASMLHWDTEDEHAIPLTPMWAGLAVNAVFWALVWLAILQMLMLPVHLWLRWRTGRRAGRGRCLRCGYDLGAVDDPTVTCPECNTQWGTKPRRVLRGMIVLPVLALLLVVGWVAAVGAQRIATAERLPPMHRAAAEGDAQRVRERLAAGALADKDAPDLRPLNVSPMQGARPIEWAAARGHTQVVDELIGAGAYYDMLGDRRSPLALAVACGHDDIAERLIAAGASVTSDPKTTPAPIAIAAWRGNTALLEAMFDQVDALGRGTVRLQLFSVALAGRDEAIWRMVLDRTTGTFRDERDVALAAYRWGDQDLLEAMLDRGFDARSAGDDFVSLLGRVPDPLAAIEVLVAEGVDLRWRDWIGNTALHHVCFGGEAPGAIERLVGLGVPLEARNDVSLTALHVAAGKGDAANVRVLLELGADASAKDADGRTPRTRWWAARGGTPGAKEIHDLLRDAEGAP